MTVAAAAHPGNAYLAPAFDFLFGRLGAASALGRAAGSRCYSLPVQGGVEFGPGRVSAVVRVCYTDDTLRPNDWASTTVR